MREVKTFYECVINKNVKTAKSTYSPFTFRNLVKNKGLWDYKNRKDHLFGISNDGKTELAFKDDMFGGKFMIMESQDVGNFHFGIITKAYGLFPEKFALKRAGKAQIASGTSKPEWQNDRWFGDDPRDQRFIRFGYHYYEKNYAD